MNKRRMTLTTLAAFIITIAFASAAQAVTFRSHVSITGSDANTATNCSRPNPCRNFSAAYSVTSAGGEIVALDSGGFGGLTITTSVSVLALPGQVAFIAVNPGTSGIVVNAPGGKVILRNIQFGGSGAGATTGLTVLSGNVVVHNCVFAQLATGVDVTNARADIINSDLHFNGTAINVTGAGASTTNTPPVSVAALVRVGGGSITFNTLAFKSNGRGYDGNSVDRWNIWAFGSTHNTATVNVAGNDTFSVCTDGLSPNQNPCSNQIPVYVYNTGLR